MDRIPRLHCSESKTGKWEVYITKQNKNNQTEGWTIEQYEHSSAIIKKIKMPIPPKKAILFKSKGQWYWMSLLRIYNIYKCPNDI